MNLIFFFEQNSPKIKFPLSKVASYMERSTKPNNHDFVLLCGVSIEEVRFLKRMTSWG
jgi:hypothetical protein